MNARSVATFHVSALLPTALPAIAAVAWAALFFWTVPLLAAQLPTVEFTDTILMRNVPHFGMNLSEDSWHTGAVITRERVRNGHFEGVLFRQITYGPSTSRTSYQDSFPIQQWKPVLANATPTFLTGPTRGPAALSGIEETTDDKGQIVPVYQFSRLRKKPEAFDGIMFENEVPSLGWIGQHGGDWWVFCSGNGLVRTVQCPAPPGDEGRVSAELAAGDGRAEIVAPLFDARFAESRGQWRLRFHGQGNGVITVWIGSLEGRESNALYAKRVQLKQPWMLTDVLVNLPHVETGLVAMGFSVEKGTVRLEGVSFSPAVNTARSAFRTPVVEALKRLAPGNLRAPQIGGSSLQNWLAPPERRMAYSSSRHDPPPTGNWPSHPREEGKARTHAFSLHEFMALCAEVGTQPWICTPGTFTYTEMRDLVEYLAGPVTSEMGRMRTNLGQIQPWTTVFKTIHIEIGNEAWNSIPPYLHGGYSVKGQYWNDLFRAAQTSPWASSSIRLHAGGQAVNTWLNKRIAREVPRADRLAIAPYLLHDLSAEAATWPAHDLLNMVRGASHYYDKSGWMAQNSRDVSLPLSVYEVNYHPTGGSAPLAPRNLIVSSMGGCTILMDWLMKLIAHHGCRPVTVFTLLHEKQSTPEGALHLWGTAINLKKGQERYRPLFLALEMVNSVLEGDLHLLQPSRIPEAQTPFRETPDASPTTAPLLSAYGLANNAKRAMILINMDMQNAHEIRIPSAAGRNATARMLKGKDFTSNNEDASRPPEVHVSITQGPDENGLIALEPASITVLQWEE